MRLVPAPEDPFDALLDDVRDGLAARIARGGSARDFADVMARAHRLDPEITPEASVREAARYAPVMMLERRRRRGPDHEAASSSTPATDREQPIEASSPAATSTLARPSRRVAIVGLLALAAALLLGIGIGGAVREASRGSTPRSGHALRLAEERGDAGVARAAPGDVEQAPARERSGPGEAAQALSPPAATCIQTASEPAVQEASREASDASGGSESEYLRLDRRAEAAWRRGDRRQARALLDALTRSSAPRKLVEAAYGDLSLLARQDGDRGELERLWRRYLARFPRGIFADDARADLCGSPDAATEPLCEGSRRREPVHATDATSDASPDR